MCLDVEATMCLVMRVERDGSRVMDVSDAELKGREATLCFAQTTHCSCFEPGLYKVGLGSTNVKRGRTARTAISL